MTVKEYHAHLTKLIEEGKGDVKLYWDSVISSFTVDEPTIRKRHNRDGELIEVIIVND